MAGYISETVRVLAGSTKSLNNRISSLRVFCHHLNQPWLSSSEVYRLKRVRRQLELEDTTDIKRMRPLVLATIQRYIELHGSRYDPHHLLRATMMLTAHNGLLRGGELLGGIKVKDITWEPRERSVTLHLPPTKTQRIGAGVDVRITDHEGASAYKFLRAWFRQQNLYGRGSDYVFPESVRAMKGQRAAFNFRRPASKKWFLGVVRKVAHTVGIDPKWVSAHSFRAGGATDLFLLGVPYPVIKRYGRWRSEAVMVYFREDSVVSATVAAALGLKRYGGWLEREAQRVGVRAGP